MLTLGTPEPRYSGKYLTFNTIPVTLENNDTYEYEFITRKNTHGIIAVLPITKEWEVILIKQFRIPLGTWQLEIPAGLMDKEWENPEETVRRELLEEAGYIPGSLEFAFLSGNSAGMTDESVQCFIGHDCIPATEMTERDTIERIEVIKKPLPEAFEYLLEEAKSGTLIESKVFGLLGIYFSKYQ